MCGIAGILQFNGQTVDRSDIARMTDALAHRGPDGHGCHIDSCIGLGHTRLAIVDLSDKAAQPMLSTDGRYVLCYNGEIYNYRELRSELEGLGYRFRSQSDTEVLLAALATWGAEVVPRLNGMFAFAFWDKKKQDLLLARDRYGIKPLYIADRNGTFAFASEIKAIIALPSMPVELDKEGLVEYLSFQNFFSERTLFRHIHTFPAGYTMVLAAAERSPSWNRYWDFNFQEPTNPASEQEYTEELGRLFRQAVNRQLMGDVEIGSYLSSGMDSGAITAIASSRNPAFKTFTCGFDLSTASGMELNFDERARAEKIAACFGTDHYETVLKSGDMQRSLPFVTQCLEEPRVGQSYPNYFAAKFANRFVKVVLSGTGGDEIFGGYPWRYYRAAVNSSFDQYADKYFSYWQRLVPNGLLAKVMGPIWQEVRHVDPNAIFRSVFKKHKEHLDRPEDYINHSLYFEAKTFLHGLLIVEDKLSMAHGLETRVPFLDNDLVDFAGKVPVGLKLGNLQEVKRLNENEPGHKVEKYYQLTRDGKLILRKAMRQLVPESVCNGCKQGFSAPDASWFKGESIDYVRTVLFNKRARIYDYLDHKPIQEMVTEHLDGRENRRLLIWSLLSLEQWLKHYLPA